MSISEVRVPSPPPFIPAAPDIPAPPPIPEAPSVAAAPVVLDKDTKRLADPDKYFADLGAGNAEALIKHEITAWQTLLPSTEAKVRELAEKQLRYLAYILTARLILSDCTKLIQALGRYTNEELALLLCLYKETCPDSAFIQNPVFERAAAEKATILPAVERLYVKIHRPGWETAFMQEPETLGNALVAEKERRERDNVVITADSRPHSERPRVRIAEPAAEEKKAESPKPQLDLQELMRKQQARSAVQVSAPKQTLRPKKTMRQAYKQTLKKFGLPLKPSAARLPSPAAPAPAPASPGGLFGVVLKSTKAGATPAPAPAEPQPKFAVSVTPPQ